jgi:hypothetical protein
VIEWLRVEAIRELYCSGMDIEQFRPKLL